jgi:hypothetical protein
MAGKVGGCHQRQTLFGNPRCGEVAQAEESLEVKLQRAGAAITANRRPCCVVPVWSYRRSGRCGRARDWLLSESG